LESGVLGFADPSRGRFRGFLVAAFRQFLSRRRQYESAAKRRPLQPIVSIYTADGEARYVAEPADLDTPEKLFDRAWASGVVAAAMDRLRGEFVAAGRANRFEVFHGMMTGQRDRSAREVGQQLGISEGAVRVAVHRMRQRYGELLRAEVAATLDEGESVEDELRQLLAALRPA
jgi:RNA polymerase sigma-70 factor (ECF subfamily)